MSQVLHRPVLESMIRRSRKNRYAEEKQEEFRVECNEIVDVEE